MKGDVFLPMTSSSSEPSRAEDAALRDQPRLGSTELCHCGVRTGQENPSPQPRWSLPSSHQCKEQKGGAFSLWQFHRLIPTPLVACG